MSNIRSIITICCMLLFSCNSKKVCLDKEIQCNKSRTQSFFWDGYGKDITIYQLLEKAEKLLSQQYNFDIQNYDVFLQKIISEKTFLKSLHAEIIRNIDQDFFDLLWQSTFTVYSICPKKYDIKQSVTSQYKYGRSVLLGTLFNEGFGVSKTIYKLIELEKDKGMNLKEARLISLMTILLHLDFLLNEC